MRKSAGFTLVEFVIVLVMVGVLVMIAVPVYKSHIIKSKGLKIDTHEGKQQKVLSDETVGESTEELLVNENNNENSLTSKCQD